jgi:hypothetical protein
MVSTFAFKFNLYHCITEMLEAGRENPATNPVVYVSRQAGLHAPNAADP